ncbi:MAG TPA: FG-GAP-like repeat-containing protein [Micromonosporaceae bacterium]|nr:FG-GAP-like repeat-containing protein [Micromonosporaceae bacterium]
MSDNRWTLHIAIIGTLLTAAVIGIGPATAQASAGCATRVASDFNGDGQADIAVGYGLLNASTGGVDILYGQTGGLTGGEQYISGTMLGVLDPTGSFADAGLAVQAGFFNGDCYADLAIGGGITVHGDREVVVLYGSAAGPDVAGGQVFVDNNFRPPEALVRFMSFGAPFAAGDFNGDGFTDLAMSDVGYGGESGGVAIAYGSASGLSLTGKQWFTQNTSGVPGANEAGDHFGWALSAADFNGDGRADLAIGAPGEDLGTTVDVGAVTVLHGTSAGLTTAGSQFFSLHTAGIPRAYPPSDFVGYSDFGDSLAAGDVTGDGRAELVVGAPQDSVTQVGFEGTVTLIKGSTSGLTATGSTVWTQNSPGVPGVAEINDRFGLSVCVGDFNGDGHGDVAVGSFEAIGSVLDAGSVTIIYGARTGLVSTNAQVWSQNSPGIAGSAERNDFFGSAVYAANIRSVGHSDLVIGIPNEDTGTYTDNGAIEFLRGATSGITATGSQFVDGTFLLSGRNSGAQMGGILA